MDITPPHKACHLSVKLVSRADGRSAVAAAAYRAGDSYYDERVGRHRSYRSKADVAHVEVVGFEGHPEELWNLAEAAETRRNARVAREWEVALPHELPLDAQRRLVRGYSLWLRDRYGIALTTAIHHPGRFGDVERLAEELGLAPQRRRSRRGDTRNAHAHILGTTRAWDPATRSFGAKTRALDDGESGPVEVEACRVEWQERVNAELKRHGIGARVDLRSYARQAAAGDAPQGLVAQRKQGPRATARSRRDRQEFGADRTTSGRRRDAVRRHNEDLWTTWLLLRSLRRQTAREDGTSHAIAQARERARRAEDGRSASAREVDLDATGSQAADAGSEPAPALKEATGPSGSREVASTPPVGVAEPARPRAEPSVLVPTWRPEDRRSDRSGPTTRNTSTGRRDAASARIDPQPEPSSPIVPAKVVEGPRADRAATGRTLLVEWPSRGSGVDRERTRTASPMPVSADPGGREEQIRTAAPPTTAEPAAASARDAEPRHWSAMPRGPSRDRAEMEAMIAGLTDGEVAVDARYAVPIDPESYIDPDATPQPPPTPRAKPVGRRQRQRQRVRGD